MFTLLASTYQKNSFNWQQQKFFQRIDEWIALQLSRWQEKGLDVPDWTIPYWWLQALFWLIVAGIVGLCLWQILRLLMLYWPTNMRARLRERDRFKATVQENRSISGWLQFAQDCQKQGNYSEACRALYMAMIARLNDMQLILDSHSRTDGEYTALVAQLPQSDNYQTLLQTHEQLKFGNAIISAERFQRCQRAYQAIEQGLSQ